MQIIISICKRCNLFWHIVCFNFVSPIPKIPYMKIPEIEEEACEVKPTQLAARLDPIKCAPVKPKVYNASSTHYLGFTQLAVIYIYL